MNQDQQLQLGFEHWLRCKWTAGYECVRKDDGYTDKQVQFLWECWKDISAITATQQAAPSQGAPIVTDAMVAAYLRANDKYWREADRLPDPRPFKWRNGTPKEATRVSLIAALLEASTQRGEVVVTKTEAGQIIAVTRQDEEGRILEVIAEASTQREQPAAKPDLFQEMGLDQPNFPEVNK